MSNCNGSTEIERCDVRTVRQMQQSDDHPRGTRSLYPVLGGGAMSDYHAKAKLAGSVCPMCEEGTCEEKANYAECDECGFSYP